MKIFTRKTHFVAIASLLMAGGTQAAGWQDSLSSAASQLSQNGASSGNLTGLLSSGTASLSSGSMTNAAGILQYCMKQKLASATNTENIKNQLMEKLGLNSAQAQKKDTDYTQGVAGMLKTADSQQLNLNNLGSTPLAEKVKTKACDLVLKQGIKFIS